MKSQALRKLIGTYILVTVVSVTLIVTPSNTMDPVNLPKLALMGVLAFVVGSLGLTQIKFIKTNQNRSFVIVWGIFVILLVIILLTNASDLSFKLYGTPSRNTGFLAYFSLALIGFAAAVSASTDLLKRFHFFIVVTGAILAIYGIIQWQKLDFFNYVNVYGSDVFGTFGNPNFQSAFMGMTAASSFIWTIFGHGALRVRIFTGLLVILAMFNVHLSSEQGYLNFLAGVTAGVIIYFFTTGRSKAGWTLIALSSLGATLIILGIFNSGPLANLIYKSSLQARGFYWRAGIKMMVDHPIFGVGFDGFGDWYRRSRSQSAAEFNPGIVADSAHSIPLDLGTSGGFPLLLAYLAIVVMTITSIIGVVKRKSEFDPIFASIVAAWVAYQAQSLISINQLGLGVWGWSLAGLLIGYELNTRKTDIVSHEKSSRNSFQVKEKIPALPLLVGCLSGAIGIGVSLPPYLAANNFYKSLQSQNAINIEKAVYVKPLERSRFMIASEVFLINNMEPKAIEIITDGLKIYPDSFDLWKRLSSISSAPSAQVFKAKAEMKRLDPFNPGLE
jgi:O-antigen ligase